jgi:hypothetical protein
VKAYAYHEVINAMEKQLGEPAHVLVGSRVDSFIAGKLTLKGGGRPTERCVRDAIARCRDAKWRPGQEPENKGGRPPSISEAQKIKIATAAMTLKRQLVRPTPANVRGKAPRLCLNKATGEPISDFTFHNIYREHCYDEKEDDPWHYLPTLSQDFLPSEMKPRRVTMSTHIVDTFAAGALQHQVAVDPCYSLLPTTAARTEEQRVAALGKLRWMSKKARRTGSNLRAPATVHTQKSGNALQVYWTPIFAKGKVRIFVCDPPNLSDERTPVKLNDGAELAKFIEYTLPAELAAMRRKYRWSSTPRTIVHDKATYFVNHKAERVAAVFAEALRRGGFKSWGGENTKWMAGKFGDVYPHETLISHIRRLLDHKFPRTTPGETHRQFRSRMQKVEDYLNSADFAAREAGGLDSLFKSFRDRCAECIRRKGERVPK